MKAVLMEKFGGPLVVDQGRVCGGEWVAVHGCGAVGLSAIMIATAQQGVVVTDRF